MKKEKQPRQESNWWRGPSLRGNLLFARGGCQLTEMKPRIGDEKRGWGKKGPRGSWERIANRAGERMVRRRKGGGSKKKKKGGQVCSS